MSFHSFRILLPKSSKGGQFLSLQSTIPLSCKQAATLSKSPGIPGPSMPRWSLSGRSLTWKVRSGFAELSFQWIAGSPVAKYRAEADLLIFSGLAGNFNRFNMAALQTGLEIVLSVVAQPRGALGAEAARLIISSRKPQRTTAGRQVTK